MSCDYCERTGGPAAQTGGLGRTFSRARWSAGRQDLGHARRGPHHAPRRSVSAELATGAATTSDFAQAVSSGRTSRRTAALGGTVGATMLAYEGDGQGVWKELYGGWSRGRYLHDGHSEVAAYHLGQLLGVEDLVPETLYDQGGTVQQFIEDAQVGWSVPRKAGQPAMVELSPRPPADWNIYDLLQQQEDRAYTLLALDMICGNCDRHFANFLFAPDGRLHAIDHGHATWARFGSPEVGRKPLTNSYLLMWFWGRHAGKPTTALREGRLCFPQRLVDRWSAISREEFMAAFAQAGVATSGNVNLENAWWNLRHIVDEQGIITW